jgi:hypothetical protein
MQKMGFRLASRAFLSLALMIASVSPKIARRSLWPMMTKWTKN